MMAECVAAPGADDCVETAEELARLCRTFGERQWCLATSGNFSVRIGQSHFLITRSGVDKSRLRDRDFMICDLHGKPAEPSLVPSAETPLHSCLYRLDSATGAVLHTHSVAATVLSRAAGDELEFSGFEMQKAVTGVMTHEGMTLLPVFENTQDMAKLAGMLQRRARRDGLSLPAFLVRGHGLYAWGRTLAEAQRHTEGFEFLMACALQERLLQR